MEEFDTRMNLGAIISFQEIYGETKVPLKESDLIEGIPSLALLNCISAFSSILHLNEASKGAFQIQMLLVKRLLKVSEKEVINLFDERIKNCLANGYYPVFFWQYTNLLFYELIFENFNDFSPRELTNDESKNVLDAYLILNKITSDRFLNITDDFIDKIDKKEVESVILPNFIYQKDYASSTDFTNQVTRGVKFFEYLENSKTFGAYVKEYYKECRVKNSLDLLFNLFIIFQNAGLGKNANERNHFISIPSQPGLNIDFINSLTINDSINDYKQDNSFKVLRKRMLYHCLDCSYLLLDYNFLMDQFYKAQIFAFKEFIEENGYKGNFLSVKGKEFMEDVYFRLIIERCFPHYIRKNSKDARMKNGNEICDYYLRSGNNIILIEFKDTLLNSALKMRANKEDLYSEFDKKFYENQKKSPKAVKQLFNAIKYIESNTLLFDTYEEGVQINIYPIIVYTDLSFGYEGINKILKKKYRELIAQEKFSKLVVKDITLINLNYFEIWEDYLKEGKINLCNYIDSFHLHIEDKKYSTTPFEVFSKLYAKEKIKEDMKISSFFSETYKQIFAYGKNS